MGKTLFPVILVVNLFLTLLTVTVSTTTIKHLKEHSTSSAVTSLYIVYTDNPGKNPQPYYLQILTSALGSINAAKEALVYSYTNINGFSAKLTPNQAPLVKAQNGVLVVVRDESGKLRWEC